MEIDEAGNYTLQRVHIGVLASKVRSKHWSLNLLKIIKPVLKFFVSKILISTVETVV